MSIGTEAIPAPMNVHFPGLLPDKAPIDIGGALRAAGHPPPTGLPGVQEGKYDLFNQQAGRYFRVSDAATADVDVYPYRAQDDPAETRRVAEDARARGVGCLFVDWGDADVPVGVPHGSVYRQSMFADRKLPHEHALPAFCNDPLAGFGGAVQPRPKADTPTVGFCGYVSNPLLRGLFRLAGKRAKSDGLSLRARVLRAFRHPDVRTRFIRRASFFGGTQGRFHHDVRAQYVVWQEYLENVLGSDYTICVRGAGNYSYRLYEVLAAGRVPVFVNTNCVLPFDDEIDWKRHCVWVEQDQIARAAEVVAAFHAGLSDADFVALQHANRALWERKLSPLGFYRHALGREVSRARADRDATPQLTD